MSKREQWRAKAARYLHWYRAARQLELPHSMPNALVYFGWYREARGYADYWERNGEQARAPRWYHPDMPSLYPTANGRMFLT